MAKEKKLDDGWQIGFTIAGCFLSAFVMFFLKGAGVIGWSWWIVCSPLFVFYVGID